MALLGLVPASMYPTYVATPLQGGRLKKSKMRVVPLQCIVYIVTRII